MATNQGNLLSHSSGGPKFEVCIIGPKSRYLQGHIPIDLWGDFFLVLSFWWFQAFLQCGRMTAVSATIFTQASLLCFLPRVCVLSFLPHAHVFSLTCESSPSYLCLLPHICDFSLMDVSSSAYLCLFPHVCLFSLMCESFPSCVCLIPHM